MTRTVLLGEIAKIGDGLHGTPIYSTEGSVPFINGNNLENGKIVIKNNTKLCDTKEFIKYNKQLSKDTILLSINGTIGNLAKYDGFDYVLGKSACYIDINNPQEINRDYLYYLCSDKKFQDFIKTGATGTTIKNVPLKAIRSYRIELPDMSIQKKIADSLAAIDEKIELNRKMNETLEQMGQALFRHYFIDNPEAERWEDGTLGGIITNYDSKRKPLSSRQREEMKGKYRYFGATSVMDHINDYIFDGKYLLLAEDGSVIKDDGTPYLQYIWGKFWVNNHTHILQAKDPFTVEYLYLLLSQSNVQSLINGAVQLKINQKAMNSFRIKLPPNDLVSDFCEKIDPMFALRRQNEEETQTLTTLRDTLLPRLINGKVMV